MPETSTSTPLAYCQNGHKLAWLMFKDKQPEIHYWVAVAGLTLRSVGAVDNGHFNYGAHESIEPLATSAAGNREVMCRHGHGGEGALDLADLLPVIRGDIGPLVIHV